RFLEKLAVVGAQQAKVVRAPALHEAQIACVINRAAEIGVLIVDPNRHDMPAGADLAVERACRRGHRHGTFCAIAVSQFLPSNSLIASVETSTPSRQRTLTSILSGSERGT